MVRQGGFQIVQDKDLRRSLEVLKTKSDEGEWNRYINDAKAYTGYVHRGSSRENAGFPASTLAPGMRTVATREAAQLVRDRSIEDNPWGEDTWRLIHRGLRAEYGTYYDWDSDDQQERARQWAHGERKPYYDLGVGTYEPGDLEPGKWYNFDVLKQNAEGPSFWKLMSQGAHNIISSDPPVIYVEPPKNAQGERWLRIPEYTGEPTSSVIWPSEDAIKSGPLDLGTELLEAALKESPDLVLINPLSVPQMWKGGEVTATPGGTLVNLGEGGYDEVVIPLDQSVLADIFNSIVGKGGTADTNDLAEIAKAIHDVSRMLGGLEVTIGKSVYEISASNKGMGEALHLATNMEKELQASGTLGQGSKMSFIGTERSFVNKYDGDVMNLPYWQKRLAQEKLNVDNKFSWEPFKAPLQKDMPKWSSGFDTSSGVHTMSADYLRWMDPKDVTQAKYQEIYGKDVITKVLEDLYNKASTPAMIDTPYLDALGKEVKDSAGNTIMMTVEDPTGLRVPRERPRLDPAVSGAGQYVWKVSNSAKGVLAGDPLAAAYVPPRGWEKEGFRPNFTDMWELDGDSIRVLTTPVRTRGIDPLAVGDKKDATVLGSAVDKYGNVAVMRALEHTLMPDGSGDVDVETFTNNMQLMTENMRIKGVDAPEHYEPGGAVANAILTGFMQHYNKDGRLFFNVEPDAAFGEDESNLEARTVVDVVGVAPSGEQFRVQDYLMTDLWTRADPRSAAQRVSRDIAIAEERGLANPYFMDKGWGYDVDIRSKSDAEKELMAKEVAAYQTWAGSIAPEIYAKLTPEQKKYDFEDFWNKTVDGTRVPTQVSTLVDATAMVSNKVTLDSLVATFAERGITGGYPDPAQFKDMLEPGQHLHGDAVVLHAAFGDDPYLQKYRDQLLDRNSPFKKAAVSAAKRYQRQMELAGNVPTGAQGLVTMMPLHYSELLYGTTEPVEVVGKTNEELGEHLDKLRETGYAEAEKMLGDEQEALKTSMGVSGSIFDTSAWLLSSAEATEHLREFEANWKTGDPSYNRKTKWEEFLKDGYRSRTNARIDYEQQQAVKAGQLKQARANIRETMSYFDPYAEEVTAEMAETGFENTINSPKGERGVFGFVGRATGIGDAQDMYTTALQFAVANQNLRNDPSAWSMAKMTGASALYEGGFQSSLVQLAVDKFEVGRGGVALSEDLYASKKDAKLALGALQQQYGPVIDPFVKQLEHGIDVGKITNEFQLVTKLFQEMVDNIVISGKAGALATSTLNFTPEFENANLQRSLSGGVEYRATLSNIPDDFLQDLQKMSSVGEAPEIYIPGYRTSYQTERAREVDPYSGDAQADSGVWEVGGATYRYRDTGEKYDLRDTVNITEHVTRKIENKEKDGKWYTYVDGKWDQNEPTKEASGDPKKIIHGIREQLFDVYSGQMMTEHETYEGERVLLYQGEAIDYPTVKEIEEKELKEARTAAGLPDLSKIGEMLSISADTLSKFDSVFMNSLDAIDTELPAAMELLLEKAGWTPEQIELFGAAFLNEYNKTLGPLSDADTALLKTLGVSKEQIAAFGGVYLHQMELLGENGSILTKADRELLESIGFNTKQIDLFGAIYLKQMEVLGEGGAALTKADEKLLKSLGFTDELIAKYGAGFLHQMEVMGEDGALLTQADQELLDSIGLSKEQIDKFGNVYLHQMETFGEDGIKLTVKDRNLLVALEFTADQINNFGSGFLTQIEILGKDGEVLSKFDKRAVLKNLGFTSRSNRLSMVLVGSIKRKFWVKRVLSFQMLIALLLDSLGFAKDKYRSFRLHLFEANGSFG